MKRLLICLSFLISILTPTALANQNNAALEVTTAWARPTANSNTPGGVFLTITNYSQSAQKLTAVTSEIAAMAHLHATGNEGGMMTMDMVEQLLIPAGESVKFAPGGYHIMLMGLSKKLTKGDVFDLTLTFEGVGNIVVAVTVMGMAGPISTDAP
jgi:periplasmic copper chaperone A